MKKADLRTLLETGDKRSIGFSNQVVEFCLEDRALLKELLRLLNDQDAGVRMRAFDAFEKVTSQSQVKFSKSETAFLLKLGLESDQQEVLWHWCQVVPPLSLTPVQVETAFAHLDSLRNSSSRIVWTFALQAMIDLAKKHPRLLRRARTAIEEDSKKGTAAVKARCRKLLLSFDQK